MKAGKLQKALCMLFIAAAAASPVIHAIGYAENESDAYKNIVVQSWY